MSVRNKDPKGHWRCKTVAFRVSPEEGEMLDMQVQTSGLLKQDFLVQKALNDKVVVHPNIRVQKYISQHLAALTEQLKEVESVSDSSNTLEKIRYLLDMIKQMGGDEKNALPVKAEHSGYKS